MEYGLQSEYKESDLDLLSYDINEFDVHSHYANKIYLNQLIINSHKINPHFQTSMQNLFKLKKRKINTNNSPTTSQSTLSSSSVSSKYSSKYGVLYQPAPVKLASRCVIKAVTDYGNKVSDVCFFVFLLQI